MGAMNVRRPLVALALVVAACGSSEAAEPDDSSPTTPVPTIGGVGFLPDTIARESEPPVIVRPPVNEDGTVAELVGQQVAGNRIILIGDSILASTARRFGGEMCDGLVPLGWVVEVDAEPGRFVEFGNRVLDPFRDMPSRPLEETERWHVVRTARFGDDTLISLER